MSKEEQALRKWLRGLSASERLDFIRQLTPLNGRLALSLVQSSQLPTHDVESLLKEWLASGNHNPAKALIQFFEPALGVKRFWRIVDGANLTQAQRDFFEYHRNGHTPL